MAEVRTARGKKLAADLAPVMEAYVADGGDLGDAEMVFRAVLQDARDKKAREHGKKLFSGELGDEHERQVRERNR